VVLEVVVVVVGAAAVVVATAAIAVARRQLAQKAGKWKDLVNLQRKRKKVKRPPIHDDCN
jgi:hypothetical protein